MSEASGVQDCFSYPPATPDSTLLSKEGNHKRKMVRLSDLQASKQMDVWGHEEGQWIKHSPLTMKRSKESVRNPRKVRCIAERRKVK